MTERFFTLRMVVGCDPTIGLFPSFSYVNDNPTPEQESFDRAVSRELIDDLADE